MAAQMMDEQQKALQEKLKNMSPEELREFQKQQCIFCQIVTKKVPSKKIYEDEHCIAILDINPATAGHILLLPKEHYMIMPQVPEKELGHLLVVSKYLSQILLKTLKATGTTIFIANGSVAGQRAQHFLLHLIPRKEQDGLFVFDERVIDKPIRDKVKGIVEKRFNELMGISKEVVSMKEQEKEPAATASLPFPPPAGSKEEPKAETKEEPPEGESEESTSLDDIANLFK